MDVVNTWEQPEEPEPEWRHGDIGGAFEQPDAETTRHRMTYWRFFYSRDPKRRSITGRKKC